MNVVADDAPLGRIAVVVGSTRPTRICPGIARWVMQVAQEDSPLRYELVDLAEVALLFLDEPLKAALHQYTREHTRAWSRTVSSFDGFIFATWAVRIPAVKAATGASPSRPASRVRA